jgi:hypothetical protein
VKIGVQNSADRLLTIKKSNFIDIYTIDVKRDTSVWVLKKPALKGNLSNSSKCSVLFHRFRRVCMTYTLLLVISV